MTRLHPVRAPGQERFRRMFLIEQPRSTRLRRATTMSPTNRQPGVPRRTSRVVARTEPDVSLVPTTSITDFILARIDEEEALARDAHYDGQRWIPEEEAILTGRAGDLEPSFYLDRKRDASHAAKWSPARVLAECEAKRLIVELHPEIISICQGCGDAYPCRTLLALAQVYADRPDYLPVWRV